MKRLDQHTAFNILVQIVKFKSMTERVSRPWNEKMSSTFKTTELRRLEGLWEGLGFNLRSLRPEGDIPDALIDIRLTAYS